MKIIFQIEFKTLFGQAVYIIGASSSLGRWETPLRMEWTEGDVWKLQLKTEDLSSHYKYLIAPYDDGSQVVRWERGPNRVYDVHNEKSQSTEILDVWEHRKIGFQFKLFQNVDTLRLTGSTQKLGGFVKDTLVQNDQFTFLLNIIQDQDVFYQYSYERLNRSYKVLKSFNVNLISENVYDKNCQIVFHKHKEIYKLDNKIFYGGIPRTNSDFEFLQHKDIKTVIELVQEENSNNIPMITTINDIQYIRINLLALRQKFTVNYLENLFTLLKYLITQYDTFFLCNQSVKHLKRYLEYYRQIDSSVVADRTLSKALTSQFYDSLAQQ